MPPHPSDLAADAPDEHARAAAVVEARAVFDDHWPRWARAHDRPVRPPPSCEAPRITLVGETADEFHYVAVVRFAFEVDGVHFAGLARGPVAAPTFRVWQLAEPGAGDGRWWRRLTGRGRHVRQQPSTVVP